MGIRGEIFSTALQMKNRTYFFNVKENRLGDLYLNLVESKNEEGGGFDRQSIVIFADELQDFLGVFDESLKQLEKAVREKRKSSVFRRDGGVPYGERGVPGRERGASSDDGGAPRGERDTPRSYHSAPRGGYGGSRGDSGGSRSYHSAPRGDSGGSRGGYGGEKRRFGEERGGGRQQFYSKRTDRDGGRSAFQGRARPGTNAGGEALVRDEKLSGKGKNIVVRKKRDKE
jgi:hypothetical protein